jgi:hypothetical protein
LAHIIDATKQENKPCKDNVVKESALYEGNYYIIPVGKLSQKIPLGETNGLKDINIKMHLRHKDNMCQCGFELGLSKVALPCK